MRPAPATTARNISSRVVPSRTPRNSAPAPCSIATRSPANPGTHSTPPESAAARHAPPSTLFHAASPQLPKKRPPRPQQRTPRRRHRPHRHPLLPIHPPHPPPAASKSPPPAARTSRHIASTSVDPALCANCPGRIGVCITAALVSTNPPTTGVPSAIPHSRASPLLRPPTRLSAHSTRGKLPTSTPTARHTSALHSPRRISHNPRNTACDGSITHSPIIICPINDDTCPTKCLPRNTPASCRRSHASVELPIPPPPGTAGSQSASATTAPHAPSPAPTPTPCSAGRHA